MKRYLIFGSLLFLGFAISFAPAGLVDRALSSNTQGDLIDPRGTLWRGQGQLITPQLDLGQLDWAFQPSSLLSFTPRYHWSLTRTDGHLTGTAATGVNIAQLDLRGEINATAINAFLRSYDISIQGLFNIQPSSVEFDHGGNLISGLEGQIDWNGGLVRYALSGVLREATLPAMSAYLSINKAGLPQAVVYTGDQQTPLLIASIDSAGFAKVGITKLFTKILNNPWPGSDADHVIVLQVEEKII